MIRLRFLGVVSVVAVAALALTFVLWPIPPEIVLPPPALVPYFAFVIVCECISFGIGVAFLIYGYPLVRSVAGNRASAWGGYAGIAWFFLNWWPHESLHRTTPPTDFVKMIRIQFGFHLTLIAAACLVAAFFADAIRAAQPERRPAASETTRGFRDRTGTDSDTGMDLHSLA